MVMCDNVLRVIFVQFTGNILLASFTLHCVLY